MKNTDYIMPVAVANAVIVAIFAALAYVFNTWWIVLFSALFLMEVKHGNGGDNSEKG